MASFGSQIDKFVKKTGINGALVTRKIALDAFKKVLEKSPVDQGRFRGNWRLSINQVNLATNNKGTDDPFGTAPQMQTGMAASAVAIAKWEDTIIISNNLPYAKRLERGSSKQAPGGILAPTIAEMSAGLDTILAELE